MTNPCNNILVIANHFVILESQKMLISEAATGGVLCEKVLLEISQNSQENTCARVSFLIKLQAWGLQLYYKGESGTSVFLWILRNF